MTRNQGTRSATATADDRSPAPAAPGGSRSAPAAPGDRAAATRPRGLSRAEMADLAATIPSIDVARFRTDVDALFPAG